MKESVTKFNLEAAFKALDEIEIPVARKGIAANKVNLKETFNRKSKLDLLLEDYYDVNDTEELEAAKEAREAEVAKAKLARIEKIVDLNAESEEDLLPSYVGKMIIQCPQCMTLFYKNEEDIARSEEDPEVVNVNEVCQHCGNASGYSVIGKVDQVGEEEAEEYDLDAFEDENELDLDFPEGTEEVDPEGTGEDARDDELDLEPVNTDEEETTEEGSEEEVKESLTLNEDINTNELDIVLNTYIKPEYKQEVKDELLRVRNCWMELSTDDREYWYGSNGTIGYFFDSEDAVNFDEKVFIDGLSHDELYGEAYITLIDFCCPDEEDFNESLHEDIEEKFLDEEDPAIASRRGPIYVDNDGNVTEKFLEEDTEEEFLDEEELEAEEVEETEEVVEEEKVVISAEEVKEIAAEAGEEVAEVVKENPEVEAEEIKKITDEVVDNALEVEDETEEEVIEDEEIIEDEEDEEIVEESLTEAGHTIHTVGSVEEVYVIYLDSTADGGYAGQLWLGDDWDEAERVFKDEVKQAKKAGLDADAYKLGLYEIYLNAVSRPLVKILEEKCIDDMNSDLAIDTVNKLKKAHCFTPIFEYLNESLTEALPREPQVYDKNGNLIKVKDPEILKIWAKVIDYAEANNINFWNDYKIQKDLIDKVCTKEEKKKLSKVEFDDGITRAAYTEAVDKELDNKLKAHNEYIEYLKDEIEKTEKSLENAKNDFVKKSIQSKLDALKVDLEAALPEALKDEVVADELPTPEESGLEDAAENKEEKDEEVKESLNETYYACAEIDGEERRFPFNTREEAKKYIDMIQKGKAKEFEGKKIGSTWTESLKEETKEALTENVIININVEGEKEESPVIIPVEANVETGCLPEAECPVDPIVEPEPFVEPQPEVVEEPVEEVETEEEISEEELEDEEIIEEACKPLTEEDNFDLSDAEAEELFNSDEFKQPISEEEVEGYLGESSTFESVFEEIDELDDESIQNCICESLTEVYSNVENFVMESCEMDKGTFKINGTINFKSGNTTATSYVFNEAKYITEDRIVLNGMNETLSKDGNFVLEARVNPTNKSMVANTLSYSYKINNNLVEGLIKNNK